MTQPPDDKKRESKPAVQSKLAPPNENPNHCPKCDAVGKYCGRQHQSDKYMLIAWKCGCGNAWKYIYPHDELPDPNTLV